MDEIKAARPAPVPLPPRDGRYASRVHGAWLGRCAGCLLGKPAEGWPKETLWGYLHDTGNWPMRRYMRYADADAHVRAKFELETRWKAQFFADRVRGMPVDDDTNYTVLAYHVVRESGMDFSSTDVAVAWLGRLPVLQTFTAERVAYRNLLLNLNPPVTAEYRNPYREWIGAQIRADFYGYVCPGSPERAAELAWRDASVSHTKNGIYGSMWVAATLAAALVVDDPVQAMEAGLAQVPALSRFSDGLRRVLACPDYAAAMALLNAEWDDSFKHDWCHTIPNAMIVAAALRFGGGDFGTTVGMAVQPGFDTDCNGATAGSILGAILGAELIPRDWTDVLDDTLYTSVGGYGKQSIAGLARETVCLAAG